MSIEKIADRYAKGFISLLQEDDTTNEEFVSINQQLQSVLVSLENEQVKQVLFSPAISSKVKTNVLDSILKQIQSDKRLGNFLKIIVKNGRFDSLPVVAISFQKHLKNLSGQANAQLVSASTLDVKHVSEIRSFLEKKFDTSIDLDIAIDPKIMGGFIVKMGHRILDYSLKTKLENLTNAALSES